jgi:hypothetical protein
LVPAASGASLRWTQKVGRYPEAVAVDGAGNTYVSGRTTLKNGDTGALLASFGPAGGKRWTRTWSPLASDFGYGSAVAVGDDGTVYWGGVLHAKGCEGGGWFVRAYGPNGRLLWHRDQNGWEGCTVATNLTDLAPGRDILALSLTDHGCCADPFADGYVRALDPEGGKPMWRTDIEPGGGVPLEFFDTATSVSVGGLDNVFVGGWAATQKVLDDIPTYDGRAFVQKLSSGGAVLWRRTIRGYAMGRPEVHVSARGDRLMVATVDRAGRLSWGGGAPPTGWLGRYSLGGDLMWSRTWGDGWRHGAEPSGVSVGPAMDTWVVGTTRDASDRSLDLFARRYSATGRLLQTIQLDGPTRKLWGGGVAAVSAGAAFTGSALTASIESIGRVWMYGPS